MSITQYPCKICSNTQNNTFYTAREMMYGLRDEFTYFQCSQCKCLQIADIPSDMSKYYLDNYYSYQVYKDKKFEGLWGKIKKLQYRSSIFPKGIIRRAISFILPVKDYKILDGLGVTPYTRILDVGSGNGKSFLYPLKVCGLNHVMGCDPYLKKQIQYPNGLTIEPCFIYEIKENFDIITYHHSFEHVADPFENLQQVKQLLVKGGTCIIRIPTCSSYAWKHYRTNWAQLDAPRHFFLHSVESMQYMAQQAGLELYKIQYDSTHFQFSGSEKYVNNTSLRTPRKKGLHHFLKRKFKKWGYTARAKKLNKQNEGDQAAFFFRKH